MKNVIAILLSILLLVAAVACTGETGTPVTVPDPGEPVIDAENPIGAVAGGWANAESFALTDELRAVFEKALEGLVGVNYTPIACLGTQVVAGTNYCFLAQGTVVYPGATPTYMLVYVYEDLSGNAQILNIADMPIVPNGDGTAKAAGTELLDGGWSYAESYEITDTLQTLLNKATENLDGASYTPVAYLGSQVVAGMNHCILCQITPVVPDPQPVYALVYLYENLEGGAELTEAVDLDVGALCTYGA